MFNANGTKRAVWLAVLSCCLAPWPSLAAAPEVEVRTKLTAMERLLSTSLHGESWVNYLYLKELRQQVDAASNVDPLVLEKVLTRLNSWESHILQRPPFVELRHAVQTWLESLPAPAAAELSDMAEAAKARYVPRQSVSLDVVQAKVLADKKKLEQFLTIGPHGAAWRNGHHHHSGSAQSGYGLPDPDRDGVAGRLDRAGAGRSDRCDHVERRQYAEFVVHPDRA